MESIITTFHVDWKIILAQAINFAIVFIVVYIFALKPLNKLMAERAEKIAKGVSDAKSNAELLSATQTQYEEIIAKAKAEAHTLFQDGRKKADQKRNEMLEAAKEEMALMISNGKKSMEAQKVKMVEEARQEVVKLAVEATKKLLEKQASETSAHDISKVEKL